MTPPSGDTPQHGEGFTVTVADMWQLLTSIDRKVDSLVQTAEGLEERVADHEARLRVLEALRRDNAPDPRRTAPATIIALLISGAAIVTTVLLYAIDR